MVLMEGDSRTMRFRDYAMGGLVVTVVALLLQGCATPPAAPTARVFASDLAGAARSCTVPKVAPVAGQQAPVTMAVGNDGGWCAITVDNGGKPYSAGLLVTEPAHGKVLIHTVGDATRIDYTPDVQYAGADSFGVRLIPGDATITASVTVSRP
jgi:hypothetical protein